MIYPFTTIVIIYNPNSTGRSKQNAQDLQRRLQKSLPKMVNVECMATERASHAETIAFDVAKDNAKVLIVSSSGDGGYNEVVNGLLRSKNPNAAALVLPSGNANDHYEATAERTIEERIITPIIKKIDTLKVTATKDSKPFTRYAHSYVGAGLTATIGKKLTEATLNPINEKWLVLKYLLTFKSVMLKVEPDIRWRRYSSVVFGNIDRMSKIITLAPESRYDDGKIEVYELRTNSTVKTIASLLLGSLFGLKANSQVKEITFQSRKLLEVQFDGEVIRLDAHSEVTISVVPNSLTTLE